MFLGQMGGSDWVGRQKKKKHESLKCHEYYFRASEATVELSVDMDVDVFDSRCHIGQMAGQITTRLGTVTLQVVTSSSSES